MLWCSDILSPSFQVQEKKKGICCEDTLAALIASPKFVSPNETVFNRDTCIAPGFLISSSGTSVGNKYSFFCKKRKNVITFLFFLPFLKDPQRLFDCHFCARCRGNGAIIEVTTAGFVKCECTSGSLEPSNIYDREMRWGEEGKEAALMHVTCKIALSSHPQVLGVEEESAVLHSLVNW